MQKGVLHWWQLFFNHGSQKPIGHRIKCKCMLKILYIGLQTKCDGICLSFKWKQNTSRYTVVLLELQKVFYIVNSCFIHFLALDGLDHIYRMHVAFKWKQNTSFNVATWYTAWFLTLLIKVFMHESQMHFGLRKCAFRWFWCYVKDFQLNLKGTCI
jgi:hypothetical protein